MSEVKELPKGWGYIKLSQACEIYAGVGFPKKNQGNAEGKYPFYKVSDISINVKAGNKYLNSCNNHIDDKTLRTLKAKLIPVNTIVFAKIGEALKLNRRALTSQPCLIDNNAIGVKAIENIVLVGWLFLIFKQIKLEDYSRATTVPSVRKSDIEDIDLVIPPIETQQVLVSKVEELFSEVDKGIENLLTTQQQLKTYRQSVLKWAFEGKLTEEWRKKNTKKVKSLIPRAGIELNADLPEGWEWVKLGSQANLITKGASPKWQGFNYVTDSNQLLFVTSENVRENFMDLSEPKYIQLEFNEKQKRSILQKGDVLFNLVGASIGRAAIFTYDTIANINQAVAVIRLKETLSNKYLSYLLNSESSKQKYLSSIVDVARANLSLADTGNVDIPFCSIQEQQAIVEEIESRLSVADKMEEGIATSLQQAEALKQSILKMAFEGRLVSEVEVVREKAITKPSKKSKNIKLPVEVYPRIKEGIAATDLHAGIIAMIVDLHEKHPEHLINLTHVKCEKIAHLVEAKLGISLGRMPVKDAAGPDDFPHLKKVEHRANKCNWLKVIKQDIGYTYQSKSGASKIITKVETVLSSSELNQVKSLMNEFLKFDLERSEVIATVYAGWNNLLILGQQPTDEEIVFESRENWSKRKLLIERGNFFKALIWMRKHGYVPEGKGSLVLKKSEIQKIKNNYGKY